MYGTVFQTIQIASLPDVTAIMDTSRMSQSARGLIWSKMPAVASSEKIIPSGSWFQTKLRWVRLGVMLVTIIRGLPGMNFGKWRDMNRPWESVPPPGLYPTISRMVWPLK